MTSLKQDSTLGEFADQFIAGADQELARLDEQRARLQAELDATKDAMKRITAVLRAFAPKEPKRKAKAKNQNGNFSPSDERLAALEKWLAATPNNAEITTAVINKAFPEWSSSYVAMVAKWAREQGWLRKSGQSGSTVLYRKAA